MSKDIESAIFDIGGVLHSNEMPSVKEDIIKTLGITEEEFNPHWREISPDLGNGRISEIQFWDQFLKKVGYTGPLPEESLLVRGYNNRLQIYDDVLDIARGMKAQDIQIALLSNTIATHVDYLEKRGLFDQFDIRVFSNEVGISKPDPKIYIITLEKLGTDPTKTVFIDDRQENVDAANNLGIRGILFEGAEKLKRDLSELGVNL